MKPERITRLLTKAVAIALVVGFSALLAADQKTETPAQAGEQVGAKGTFVRIATNNEGWVVVGYRVANDSVGEPWMLLDVGMTLTQSGASHTITRDDIKLVTPDHEVLSLPTEEEFLKIRGSLAPLVRKATIISDPINYFPQEANTACPIKLFADSGGPGVGLARDEVELSSNRGCVGRLYFEVPGGIQYGNYNLDVVFEKSIVKVPIEIMTEERAKEFTKQLREAEKEAKHQNHDH